MMGELRKRRLEFLGIYHCRNPNFVMRWTPEGGCATRNPLSGQLPKKRAAPKERLLFLEIDCEGRIYGTTFEIRVPQLARSVRVLLQRKLVATKSLNVQV